MVESLKKPVVGIDLGTTTSCVAVVENGKVVVIHNKQGNKTTPSIVSFTDDDILVGDPALNKVVRNAQNTVYDSKRLIGMKF